MSDGGTGVAPDTDRCDSCGHLIDAGCPCFCCVTTVGLTAAAEALGLVAAVIRAERERIAKIVYGEARRGV